MNFLLQALAAYRLTDLIVEDVISDPIKNKIFAKHPPHPQSLSYILTCKYCCGVHSSAVILAGNALAPRIFRPLTQVLALAGAVSLTNKSLER